MPDTETLDLMSVTIAVLALVIASIAAWAAWRVANTARLAALAPVIDTLRSHQSALSDANTELSNFVREHKGRFAKIFDESKLVQNQLSKARRESKNTFTLASIYIELGILKRKEAKIILSTTSVDIYLGVIERMEKSINIDYNKRPFEVISKAFGMKRLPTSVQVTDQSIKVDEPS